MIPVDQRIIGEMGDCFTCCLASLLELPYEEVPYFIALGSHWHQTFFNFIFEHGYEYKGLATSERIANGISTGVDGYFIVSGESPRGFSTGHAVIYQGTEMVHDPHPSKLGIIGEPEFWMIEREK